MRNPALRSSHGPGPARGSPQMASLRGAVTARTRQPPAAAVRQAAGATRNCTDRGESTLLAPRRLLRVGHSAVDGRPRSRRSGADRAVVYISSPGRDHRRLSHPSSHPNPGDLGQLSVLADSRAQRRLANRRPRRLQGRRRRPGGRASEQWVTRTTGTNEAGRTVALHPVRVMSSRPASAEDQA